MRCAIALYQVMNPDSIGSYDSLVSAEPLPGDEPLEVWGPCLHGWAVARLGAGDHRFGMYRAAVVLLDAEGRPDEEAMEVRFEEDVEPVEEYVFWSGVGELVEAG